MKFLFTHLFLENWRNFRKVELPLRERMFIVGPNASGKSNLLDAFKFLADIAKPKGSLASAIEDRGGFTRIRSLHAHGRNQRVRVGVRLVIADTTWEYQLILSGRRNGPAVVDEERVLKNNVDVIVSRPNNDDRADPRLCEQTHLEQLTQNARFRSLADALASVAHVHIVPQVAKSAFQKDEMALRNAPGSDFIERLATLPDKRQRGALRRIEKLLRIAVPQFSQLSITREQRTGRPHLEAQYKHWRGQGALQNEQEFSDGTLRLIGLLWAILDGSSPLLLEEPELSLHEAVVEQLPQILAKASIMRGRQIIVTTHAEKALDDPGISQNEVVELLPSQDDTKVNLASDDEDVRTAAKGHVPLGTIISRRTRPTAIEQLTQQFRSEPA